MSYIYGHLTDEQVIDYVDGEIPAEDRVKMDQHLRNCHQCRQAVAQDEAYKAQLQPRNRKLHQ